MSPLTFVHVVAGFSGLSSGVLVMAWPNKGNKTHKRIGLVYFITMMISTLLSIYLSIEINNMALLSIGLFTFYMLVGGYLSTPKRWRKYKFLYWPLILIGLGSGLYMMATGVIFLLVFGGLQIWLVIQDLVILIKKNIHPLDITRSHAGKMAGSFIAASTAFVVNVIFTGGEWWHWLLPTFAITPLITIWNVQLKNKKKRMLARD